MSYWEDKVTAFLHDPPTKAFNIVGHKQAAKRLLDVWYIAEGGAERYDHISAAADRPGVPGHGDGCSVDFKTAPELTHPISRGRITLELQGSPATLEDAVTAALSMMPLNKELPDKSKFFSVAEGLRQKLVDEELTLSSVWSKLPADTRIPDHSIWHHNALVSAMASCGEEPQFFVFSLGPVQGFISESRKLRDLWAGSAILSYLTWAGMRAICDELGPDHIVYPSLSGQPLFSRWLEQTRLTEQAEMPDSEMLQVASFPNKFVALLPKARVKEIAEKIEQTIRDDWQKITNSVYAAIKQHGGANPNYLDQLWKRQAGSLWEFYWAATPWLGSPGDVMASDCHPDDMKRVKELAALFKESSGYDATQGTLYQPSHDLAQAVHASLKNTRRFHENFVEPGEKCVQCGKRQRLTIAESGNGVQNRDIAKSFWEKVKKTMGVELKDNERLCAICLTKRMVHRNTGLLPEELQSVFKAVKFPSTTKVAFAPVQKALHRSGKTALWDDFVKQCGSEDEAFDRLHDSDEEESSGKEAVTFLNKVRNALSIKNDNVFGKYYAVLMMDGDKMGDLVNGKSERLATWKDIMHSSLPDKMEKSAAVNRTRGWMKDGKLLEKRHLTPALHRAISDALAEFSLHTVPFVISKFHGKLIYAGGDDVLAVLPVDRVFAAAQELRDLYRTPFVLKSRDGIQPCRSPYAPKPGERLMIHPGEAATISAAVIIAHHKEPLRNLITHAHTVLDHEAKDKAGRDSIAVSLMKRSGGERKAAWKWGQGAGGFVERLLKAATDLMDEKESSRLMYKIDENRTALETLHRSGPVGSVNKYIESLIEKGERDRNVKDEAFKAVKAERAERIGSLIDFEKEKGVMNADALIIARFLAQTTGGYSNGDL